MSEHPSPMEAARRGPKGNVDRFLAFWLNMLVEGKQHGGGGGQIRRSIEKFLTDPELQAARDVVGDATFASELTDAAQTYFDTCRTDTGYTTTMFRTRKLEPEQITAKAAKDAASMISALARSNALTGFAQRLPALVAHGFTATFGEEAEPALRAAVGKDPAAAQIAPLIWD